MATSTPPLYSSHWHSQGKIRNRETFSLRVASPERVGLFRGYKISDNRDFPQKNNDKIVEFLETLLTTPETSSSLCSILSTILGSMTWTRCRDLCGLSASQILKNQVFWKTNLCGTSSSSTAENIQLVTPGCVVHWSHLKASVSHSSCCGSDLDSKAVVAVEGGTGLHPLGSWNLSPHIGGWGSTNRLWCQEPVTLLRSDRSK